MLQQRKELRWLLDCAQPAERQHPPAPPMSGVKALPMVYVLPLPVWP